MSRTSSVFRLGNWEGAESSPRSVIKCSNAQNRQPFELTSYSLRPTLALFELFHGFFTIIDQNYKIRNYNLKIIWASKTRIPEGDKLPSTWLTSSTTVLCCFWSFAPILIKCCRIQASLSCLLNLCSDFCSGCIRGVNLKNNYKRRFLVRHPKLSHGLQVSRAPCEQRLQPSGRISRLLRAGLHLVQSVNGDIRHNNRAVAAFGNFLEWFQIPGQSVRGRHNHSLFLFFSFSVKRPANVELVIGQALHGGRVELAIFKLDLSLRKFLGQIFQKFSNTNQSEKVLVPSTEWRWSFEVDMIVNVSHYWDTVQEPSELVIFQLSSVKNWPIFPKRKLLHPAVLFDCPNQICRDVLCSPQGNHFVDGKQIA